MQSAIYLNSEEHTFTCSLSMNNNSEIDMYVNIRKGTVVLNKTVLLKKLIFSPQK